ncbi:MAG: cysteine synthase A [Prevotella sp.]|nr:cysteine synthase A [Prevotella sp.]
MSKIAKNITDLIGHTPLLELSKLEKHLGLRARLVAKLEMHNPGRSVKDRIGIMMLQRAEAEGLIDSKTVIIEPTSGNTGIGLAIAANQRGYKLILTMPDAMSIERRSLLKALGAELVLTPAYEGMAGAVRKARELAEQYPNSFIPQQFNNPANATAHRLATGPEIWNETDGNVDFFVAGIGTGGTITGVGSALKKLNPQVRIIGVEPWNSSVISGSKAGPHKIQGIGAGFVPKVLDLSIISELIRVKDEEAYADGRLLAKEEGVLAGISSGAALHAAISVARRPENEGKTVVVLLPDTGERYLSTKLFKEE